jgi:hypothetical protein
VSLPWGHSFETALLGIRAYLQVSEAFPATHIHTTHTQHTHTQGTHTHSLSPSLTHTHTFRGLRKTSGREDQLVVRKGNVEVQIVD